MLTKSGVGMFSKTTSHLENAPKTGEGVSDYREAAWIFSDDADGGWGEQISEQSEGFDEQQEGKLDPTLSVELLVVDPVTTSSTSTYPLQLLDDS